MTTASATIAQSTSSLSSELFDALALVRRERIYASVLGWFAGPPSWRVCESRAAAEHDIDALVALSDALVILEHRFQLFMSC